MKKSTKINLCILVLGIVLIIIGCCMGVSVKPLNRNFISYDEELEKGTEINSINIDTAFSDIEICRGDTFKLVASEVPEAFALHLSEEDGVLSIVSENSYSHKKEIEVFNDTTASFSFGINISYSGDYTLYVPDEKYDEFILDASFSDVRVYDIKCKDAAIDISFSQGVFSGLEATNSLSVDTSFGDTEIDMKRSKLSDFSVDNSFGSFSINNVEVRENATICNSFGDTDINFIGNNYRVDKDNSLGGIDVDGRTNGDIRVYIDNSFGETEFSTNDNEED